MADSPDAPESLHVYSRLEERIFAASRGRHTALVLRTFFYQQNLLLWALDTQRTRALRLPLDLCIPLLHQVDDVHTLIIAR